jgi:D-glycero-alpha-D-manno-heptose-7-phosphate kinase
MILSRTPFRISFFGGGTDYPVWFRDHGGAVLATAIDKYCYIFCRYLPPFFENRYRLVYSRIELIQAIDEIQHPSGRECLRFTGSTTGLDIHHNGDLPARSGIGSSSAFTVGLLNALYGLQGRMASKLELARDAIHVEQNLIGEAVGCQDQTMAAFGGFKHVVFEPDGRIDVAPVILSKGRSQLLQDNLLLVFSGLSRNATEVASEQIRQTGNRVRELTEMRQMVDEAVKILASDCDISAFGHLLHESWRLKRSLTDRISTTEIDDLYAAARDAGAIGGKLLGAGGGGFFLLFVPPERQAAVRERLRHLLQVPFSFSSSGSQIVYYDDAESTARGQSVPLNIPTAFGAPTS